MIKTIICRNCSRAVIVPGHPAQGHPYGWYNLTVSVPPEIDSRCYRWVGMFCSVGCLMAHENTLLEYVELAEGIYDRE